MNAFATRRKPRMKTKVSHLNNIFHHQKGICTVQCGSIYILDTILVSTKNHINYCLFSRLHSFQFQYTVESKNTAMITRLELNCLTTLVHAHCPRETHAQRTCSCNAKKLTFTYIKGSKDILTNEARR